MKKETKQKIKKGCKLIGGGSLIALTGIIIYESIRTYDECVEENNKLRDMLGIDEHGKFKEKPVDKSKIETGNMTYKQSPATMRKMYGSNWRNGSETERNLNIPKPSNTKVVTNEDGSRTKITELEGGFRIIEAV